MGTTNNERVIVYVDGFNFYYGLRKSWKKYYWLDMVQLFENFMRPGQELLAVKYFSARPDSTERSLRQNAFFQANLENPKFHLILGKFLKKDITCFRCGNVIHTHEEKETDVRIATEIVADAYQKNCDISIVVSADSDMAPAIDLIKQTEQKIFVYFPPNQYSNHLAQAGWGKAIQLERYESRFKHCLLPDVVHLRVADFDLHIPPKWKAYQLMK